MSLPPLLQGETFIVDQSAQDTLTNAKWTLEVDGNPIANGDATDLGGNVYRFAVAVPGNADTKGARVVLTADGGWLVQMYTRIAMLSMLPQYGDTQRGQQVGRDPDNQTADVVLTKIG